MKGKLMSPSPTAYSNRPEVQAFITKISEQYHLDKQNLTRHFTVTPDVTVLSAINYSFENFAPWYTYAQHYLTEHRIICGMQFWQTHYNVIHEAEQLFKVPATVILAILGVETCYGNMFDHYNVLRALITLAFDYPRRSAYFIDELIHYLLLIESLKLNSSISGTYTGAFGLSNFMPSAYYKYAISYSNQRQPDLFNPHDAIFSLGNYFLKINKHTWIPQAPIAVRATLESDNLSLSFRDYQQVRTLREFSMENIYPQTNIELPDSTPAQLLTLTIDSNGDKEHWLTFHNFSRIYDFNPSTIYSMAVYQLSQRLHEFSQ